MNSERPVIGICAAIESARWAAWEVEVNLSPRTYSLAVQRAGGLALILPPDDVVAESPDELLDMIDGLILAGGSDIDPTAYGAKPDPETRGTHPERDRFEIGLGTRALERDMPVLGICRGMEMLNVIQGGTLTQHLGSELHRHTPGAFTDHGVRLDAGSLAARVVGDEHTEVKSAHHQGLDELGEGVVASGYADDGLVEAIELPDREFAVGVLWHPEEDERSRVVGALVEEARTRRSAPAQ
ncbi:MAG TPA: gamma-glutamyl-gamma-aminobutyrate hydrolase family protein [Thermoleophilaceae bacterium]|nr:gamma-glutamyl-gamma-aminobutyrate hydrolase family protein [Thermoleophilaceae bacterium]